MQHNILIFIHFLATILAVKKSLHIYVYFNHFIYFALYELNMQKIIKIMFIVWRQRVLYLVDNSYNEVMELIIKTIIKYPITKVSRELST